MSGKLEMSSSWYPNSMKGVWGLWFGDLEGESVPENELDESLGFRVWRVWRVRVYLRMN